MGYALDGTLLLGLGERGLALTHGKPLSGGQQPLSHRWVRAVPHPISMSARPLEPLIA